MGGTAGGPWARSARGLGARLTQDSRFYILFHSPSLYIPGSSDHVKNSIVVQGNVSTEPRVKPIHRPCVRAPDRRAPRRSPEARPLALNPWRSSPLGAQPLPSKNRR